MDNVLVSVDNRFSWSSPVVDSHRLRCSQSCFQEESRNKWRNKENETVPGAKNVQEKTTARLQLKLMVHVEGIRLDGSDLPRIIVYNHVTHSVCVCVRDCLFFLPITVRCALASTGLAVLLLSNASQTYNPVSEKVGAGIMSRRPLASRRPSRFHDTTRLSTGLRGEDKKRGVERRKGDEKKSGEEEKREEKKREERTTGVG